MDLRQKLQKMIEECKVIFATVVFIHHLFSILDQYHYCNEVEQPQNDRISSPREEREQLM